MAINLTSRIVQTFRLLSAYLMSPVIPPPPLTTTSPPPPPLPMSLPCPIEYLKAITSDRKKRSTQCYLHTYYKIVYRDDNIVLH